MLHENVLDGLGTILPVGLFMIYPIWLLDITQSNATPTAIEAQGWLIAVVASAMGLVRIAMWLRGSKEDKNGIETLKNIELSLKTTIEKLIENDERLSVNQQRLADQQLKALENHAKLAEALNLLRIQIQSTENTIMAGQERRAASAVSEVKDLLRNTLGGK